MQPPISLPAPPPAAGGGIRVFFLVWLGQLVSLIGSQLTGFALGVWVYQQTGSTTQFALISFSTAVPGILMSPVAGALVDRWDRRRAMMLSDGGAGLCTLALAGLLAAGRLEIWHIYVLVAVSSAFHAFQWPAYSAATTLLVPRQQYARASGMVQLAEAAAQIAAPMLAGALVGLVGLQGIILTDFSTFLLALGTLALVRFPRPAASAEGRSARGSILREAAFGWTYIRARRGLLGLLLFFAATNLTGNIVGVLFTPLVLGFASVAVLGTLMSLGGVGMLGGSLAMSTWGGFRPRVYAILGAAVVQALVLVLAGLRPSVALLGSAAFLYFILLPVTNASSQAIWQAKVPPDIQGRVFAVRRMIAWSTTPLSYLLAGPLADRVFEPLMASGGPLAGSVGRIIGTGTGRGIALLYMVLGVLTALAAVAAYSYGPLRRVESELPDALEDGQAHPA